jgi:hypothetical protein
VGVKIIAALACGCASSTASSAAGPMPWASSSSRSYCGRTQAGRAPLMTSAAIEDLCPLRAIAIVSPGPATAMTATCALIELPLVENRVCSAPTASANRRCAVSCTAHARSRVSSPWLIGRSARNASIPAHRAASGTTRRPPACAGIEKLSASRC